MSRARQDSADSIRLLVLLILLTPAHGIVFALDDSSRLPEHARAKSYGSGWECERGYRKDNMACAAIEVPANAYLSNTLYGSGWECGRGFREVNRACAAIVVPANAYPTNSPYGNGWKCGRGYREDKEACSSIKVPANAYLNFPGNTWKCNRGYRALDENCVAIPVPSNGYLVNSQHGSGWAERSMAF